MDEQGAQLTKRVDQLERSQTKSDQSGWQNILYDTATKPKEMKLA
jgi:hypothetical protein